MKFHLPSFLLGCGLGYTARALSPHFRPVAREVVTAGYRLFGAMATRAARAREDLEDLFAEARARASGQVVAPPPPGN